MAVATPERDPAALLGEVIRLSSAVSEVLSRELEVSLRDLAALHHLVGRPPLGPAELARRLGMSTASATVLVDRLERAGYLRRRPDPEDRRRVVLDVTDATATRSLAAVTPLTRAVTAIGDRLDERDRDAVAGYLTEVVAAIRAFADSRSCAPHST
jgi:DNA-binding MarR family transcriptional regulator